MNCSDTKMKIEQILKESSNFYPEFFMEEGCAVFAEALRRILSSMGIRSDIELMSNDDDEPWSDDIPYNATHVVLWCPKFPNKYIDVKGIRSPEEVADDFTMISWSMYSLDRIEDIMSDDDDLPIYGNEQDIQKTMEWIKHSWWPKFGNAFD